MRRLLAVAVIAGLVALLIGAGQVLEAGPRDTILPQDLIFVTDDNCNNVDPRTGASYHGCDEISVVNARNGAAIDHSHYRMSPGRLAVTHDAGLVLSVANNEPRKGTNFVRLMVRLAGDRPHWASRDVGSGAAFDGPVATSPDDETMLIGLERRTVEKHRVDDITLTSLGPATGSFPLQAAEIVFSLDSHTAYLIDLDGAVNVIDVDTMQATGVPIPYEPVAVPHSYRLRNTFASISPDGRYLVINTRGPNLNVLDLAERRSVLVTAPDLDATYDLEFNYAAPDQDLLAVHGYRAVVVYRFHGTDPLETLARAAVSGQPLSRSPEAWPEGQRLDTLAWTGRGDGVIAAIAGQKEYRILDWLPGPPAALRPRLDFDSCTQTYSSTDFGWQLDVVTVNKPSVPKIATSTATKTQAPTVTREVSTPIPTLAPTSTPTIAPTATLCPTPTHTATRIPEPIYLPVALREQCSSAQQRVDVALVVDASSSMEDPTSTGRRKLDAALGAVTQFLGSLALPSDQAAIIVFNSDAWLRQQLTGDRGLLASAVQGIQTAKQTRLDRGVVVAHQEFASSRRRPGNQAVMIVLTDGLANPVPASVAVEEPAAAKADQIAIFTIGLGNELDEWALQAMASRPDYYYWAPDAEDLAGIYGRVAVAIPCPAEQFWGKR